MNNILRLLAIVGLIMSSLAYADLPPQAQASHLAVPDSKVYPYASAIVVTECAEAAAVLLVDKSGIVYPQHLQEDMSEAALRALLADAAPADHITEVKLPCGSAKSA